MEWDMKQNQLHFAMKEKLKELKKELESVEQELGEIPAPHEEKSSEKVSVES